MELTKPKSATGATPVAFLAFLPGLVRLAKEFGYALAVHGSMARDYDLIAVAWTHAAKPAEELVEAIVKHTGGFIIMDLKSDPFDYTRYSPEPKPHGRLAWTIHLGGGPFIDLSIIPPESDSVLKLMDRTEESAQKRLKGIEDAKRND